MGLMMMAEAGLPARAQQTRVLTADKHNEYGLVYSLPTTSLQFTVTARRTVSKAGPYRQYASRYIGTDKVVAQDSEKWEILSVKAVPFGTADPEKQYLMQLKPGAVTSITVAEDGMLLSINDEGVKGSDLSDKSDESDKSDGSDLRHRRPTRCIATIFRW